MIISDHIIQRLIPANQRPILMGILNITPDSFYDGNRYFNLDEAVTRAKILISDGADILDIGGESTRPGSLPVATEEEIERVIPVIKEIRKFSDIPISVDTRKSTVAFESIKSGANIINDVSAGRFDKAMVDLLSSEKQTGYIIMHMRGDPVSMQEKPEYCDVIKEINTFFEEIISHFVSRGVAARRLMIDPGIGFGKTSEHNLIIINNLSIFSKLGFPIVIGVSRKRFINSISPSEPSDRLAGTLAAGARAVENGASLLRVHDVFEHKQYFQIHDALSGVNKP
jgi:dihydropteroate synthase